MPSDRVAFDAIDAALLARLDADIDNSNELARVTNVSIEITRIAGGEHFLLRLTFPNDDFLEVEVRRGQLLAQFGIQAADFERSAKQ